MSSVGETVPRSHPSDATLLLYSTGRLGQPFRVAVAAHVAHCARCQCLLEAGAAIGGQLLADAPPAPLAPDALNAILARLDEPAPRALPTPLPPTRRAWPVAPGIRHARLLHDGHESLHLFRVCLGYSLPVHHHNGPELTCVLEGAYADETGVHSAGDAVSTQAGGPHEVRAVGARDCVCLLAVTGRLRFVTPIPRAMQWFLGL
jgi:putative transcriptional regulator